MLQHNWGHRHRETAARPVLLSYCSTTRCRLEPQSGVAHTAYLPPHLVLIKLRLGRAPARPIAQRSRRALSTGPELMRGGGLHLITWLQQSLLPWRVNVFFLSLSLRKHRSLSGWLFLQNSCASSEQPGELPDSAQLRSQLSKSAPRQDQGCSGGTEGSSAPSCNCSRGEMFTDGHRGVLIRETGVICSGERAR